MTGMIGASDSESPPPYRGDQPFSQHGIFRHYPELEEQAGTKSRGGEKKQRLAVQTCIDEGDDLERVL
jgi:hypothetical protein